MKLKNNSLKELFPTYMTPLDDIGLPVGKSKIPYLIFTNDGKTAKHVLKFEKGSTKYLNEYIKILSEKYCEETKINTKNREKK